MAGDHRLRTRRRPHARLAGHIEPRRCHKMVRRSLAVHGRAGSGAERARPSRMPSAIPTIDVTAVVSGAVTLIPSSQLIPGPPSRPSAPGTNIQNAGRNVTSGGGPSRSRASNTAIGSEEQLTDELPRVGRIEHDHDPSPRRPPETLRPTHPHDEDRNADPGAGDRNRSFEFAAYRIRGNIDDAERQQHELEHTGHKTRRAALRSSPAGDWGSPVGNRRPTTRGPRRRCVGRPTSSTCRSAQTPRRRARSRLRIRRGGPHATGDGPEVGPGLSVVMHGHRIPLALAVYRPIIADAPIAGARERRATQRSDIAGATALHYVLARHGGVD